MIDSLNNPNTPEEIDYGNLSVTETSIEKNPEQRYATGFSEINFLNSKESSNFSK